MRNEIISHSIYSEKWWRSKFWVNERIKTCNSNNSNNNRLNLFAYDEKERTLIELRTCQGKLQHGFVSIVLKIIFKYMGWH